MMLTVYEDTENIFNALTAGANGYMLKRTSSKELLEAIQEVHRGGSPMTMHIARKVVQSFQHTAATAQPHGKPFRTRATSAGFSEPGTYLQGNLPRNSASATKPCIPTSVAFTKNCKSAPAPKPWPNSFAADRI